MRGKKIRADFCYVASVVCGGGILPLAAGLVAGFAASSITVGVLTTVAASLFWIEVAHNGSVAPKLTRMNPCHGYYLNLWPRLQCKIPRSIFRGKNPEI